MDNHTRTITINLTIYDIKQIIAYSSITHMNLAVPTWDLLLKVSRSGLYVVLSKDNLQSYLFTKD